MDEGSCKGLNESAACTIPAFEDSYMQKSAEIEKIGIEAIYKSHRLYLNAKYSLYGHPRKERGNLCIDLNCNSPQFEAMRDKIKENHIFSIVNVMELILSVYTTFPTEKLFKIRDEKDLPCSATRYKSKETARRNSIISKLSNKWRKGIMKQICSIHTVAGVSLENFSSEEEYNNSLTKRLVRRVEMQMANLLRTKFEECVTNYVHHMYWMQKYVKPHFHVEIRFGNQSKSSPVTGRDFF